MLNLNKVIKPTWYLLGTLENGEQWKIPIDKNPFLVGRTEDCNLKLLPGFISRRHAEFHTRGEELFIRDLMSKNGTFLNDKRIKDEEKLRDNDFIQFGNLIFRILQEEPKTGSRCTETSLLQAPAKARGFVAYYELSRREEEVLYYLLQGKSVKKLAELLYISEGTAKNHILNIFKKTNTPTPQPRTEHLNRRPHHQRRGRGLRSDVLQRPLV
jgi:DNA-binding CsgD family transcriptional regulator